MRRIAVRQDLDKAEVTLSGLLIFAHVRQAPDTESGWEIDLDDHKTGKHTTVQAQVTSLDEAVKEAGIMLLTTAAELELDDMDEVLASPLVQGWMNQDKEAP